MVSKLFQLHDPLPETTRLSTSPGIFTDRAVSRFQTIDRAHEHGRDRTADQAMNDD